MKAFRQLLFWCHMTVGVTVGAVVLLMSITGVALTYQKQMTLWADLRGLDGSPPASTAPRLTIDSLFARVGVSPDSLPGQVIVRAGANMPVELVFGADRRIFANAYTGQVLGAGSTGIRTFFRWTTQAHRFVALRGESRAIGKGITGAANLAFFFILLSGFYLWWPRNWTTAAFRNVLAFRRGLSGKARDFNWHHVIGIWSLVPLAIIVASATVISYPWASALAYRAYGEAPPSAAAPSAGTPSRPNSDGQTGETWGPGHYPTLTGVDALLAPAQARMPGWRSISIGIPRTERGPVTFNLDAGMGGQPQARAQLVYNRETGAESTWEPFDAQSPGRRFRSVLRFAHTGEVLGAFGQTVAGLVTLGAAFLVWTGLALNWRRFRAWIRRPA